MVLGKRRRVNGGGTSKRSKKMTPAKVKKIVQKTVSQSEKKHFDYAFTDNTTGLPGQGTITDDTILRIPEGDGQGNREGRHVRLTGVLLKGILWAGSTPDIDSKNVFADLFFGEIYPQQNVVNNDVVGYIGHMNYDDKRVKRLLMRKHMIVPAQADGDVPYKPVKFEKFFKLNTKVMYDSPSTGDPSSGNFYIGLGNSKSMYGGVIGDYATLFHDVSIRWYFSEV